MNIKKIIISSGFLMSLISFAYAQNTFDLSYSLTEGGYKLEFDSSSLRKGVRISVNTDVNERYEIVQNVISSLTNRSNPSIVIDNDFMVRAARGSNRYGDIRISESDTPVRSGEVVYVSGGAGQADSFSLIYGFPQLDQLPAGEYSGRISFTLRPIDSSRQQVTKTLDLELIIENSDVEPKVAISLASGGKTIYLHDKDQLNTRNTLLFKINNNTNEPFSIKQSLVVPLQSESGKIIYEGLIKPFFVGGNSGAVNVEAKNLTMSPEEIYRSTAGSENNSFQAAYRLDNEANLSAGTYRSKIQFIIDEMGTQRKIDDFDIEIAVEPVFELEISTGDKKSIIEFRDVKPATPVKTSEVILKINSNIAKTYQVTQDISGELSDTSGKAIPFENFKMQVVPFDTTKGNVRLAEKTKVKKGNSVLFVSDNRGSPDTFKVVYELDYPDNMTAGDYSANVVYDISEI